MADQIYIGNFPSGQQTNRLPFNINNDSFPNMYNFYTYRGRAKKKRGTVSLARLQRQLQLVTTPSSANPWQFPPLTLSGDSTELLGSQITGISNATQAVVSISGSIFSIGDLVTISGVTGMVTINGGIYSVLAVSATQITINFNSSLLPAWTGGGIVILYNELGITPSTLNLVINGNTYTEPSTPDGTLLKNGSPDPGSSINYATTVITIAGGGSNTIIGTFSYYPGLPTMALEEFVSSQSIVFPVNLSFDTKYSYQLNQTVNSVNFYTTNYYKNSNVPFTWSGTDYQKFWTTNYFGALWATNSVPGFNFLLISSIVTGNPNTTINTANPNPLVTGDYVWFNEITGTDAGLMNGQTFQVTVISSTQFTIVLNTAGKSINNNGIFQLLTNTIAGQDGIKWYDGDPTSSTGLPTGTGKGWVNFAPPLTATNVSIDSTPSTLYYLVGALAIVPFKDFLVFFYPYIQSSSGAAIPLPDTAIWSWNGTPFYSSLTPTGKTSDVTAYYVDQTGKGGYLPAGISQPIATVGVNQDVLLVGFGGANGRKTRFVFTGDNIDPFNFYNINSELPSTCTFSSISLDKGTIDIGTYGIAMTNQQSSERIDLDIPDSVFQIQTNNNGIQRVNSIRDFQKEWIYFSYPVNNSPWKFPTQTFLYNYREGAWSTLYENFTAHGTFRIQNKYTWKTIPFQSWAAWREPWNSGSTSVLIPNIIAGTPQGFVVKKGQGTGESPCCAIMAVMNNGGNTQINSPNHCVLSSNPNTGVGDYIFISGCLGTTYLNNSIGQVISVIDVNNFVVDIPFQSATYLGLGQFAKLCQPLLQTKQFPFYWDQGRKTRLSVQKYLMDFTAQSQVTVNIYLSQDPDSIYNGSSNPPPNSLVYSQLLYTCPESTNIGLTPANTNLQMPGAEGQYQIWHRLNTSLIGDSVQIGLTLSDAQMRNIVYATSEITLHGMVLTVERGPHLA